VAGARRFTPNSVAVDCLQDMAIRANSTGPPCSAALVRSSAAVSTAGEPRSAGGTGRRRGGYEAALYRHIDPHLFAALTFVHAQSAAGSGVQNLESPPGTAPQCLHLTSSGDLTWTVTDIRCAPKGGSAVRLSVTDKSQNGAVIAKDLYLSCLAGDQN
jgi:hypothetical protein